MIKLKLLLKKIEIIQFLKYIGFLFYKIKELRRRKTCSFQKLKEISFYKKVSFGKILHPK